MFKAIPSINPLRTLVNRGVSLGLTLPMAFLGVVGATLLPLTAQDEAPGPKSTTPGTGRPSEPPDLEHRPPARERRLPMSPPGPPMPPMPPELMGDPGEKPTAGADGGAGPGKRRQISPERMKRMWEGLSEEDRKKFLENKERWQKLPPEERRELVQRQFRTSKRAEHEINQIIEQSGAEFTPERREAFKERYMALRRDIEHEIATEIDRMREERIPNMLEGLKSEFPELGDTQFKEIGKFKRGERDGKPPHRRRDGPNPEAGDDGDEEPVEKLKPMPMRDSPAGGSTDAKAEPPAE